MPPPLVQDQTLAPQPRFASRTFVLFFSDLCASSLDRVLIPRQVGATPEGVELPRSAVDSSVCADLDSLSEENRPQLPTGPDPKWRYMWRVGPRPGKTRFQVCNLCLNVSPSVCRETSNPGCASSLRLVRQFVEAEEQRKCAKRWTCWCMHSVRSSVSFHVLRVSSLLNALMIRARIGLLYALMVSILACGDVWSRCFQPVRRRWLCTDFKRLSAAAGAER